MWSTLWLQVIIQQLYNCDALLMGCKSRGVEDIATANDDLKEMFLVVSFPSVLLHSIHICDLLTGRP